MKNKKIQQLKALFVKTFILCGVLFFYCSISCSVSDKHYLPCINLEPKDFQTTINGKKTNLFFVKNGDISLAITNFGGRIVSLCCPDRESKNDDVVLGFKNIHEYLNATEPFHGAIIGRVANRIDNGRFELNGVEYILPVNNKTNHLHGGEGGFHNVVWDVKSINDTSVVLRYFSEDGEMGYPGNVKVEVLYSINLKNEIIMQYKATSDSETPLMLTNHAFFNLAGEASGTINYHVLQINADSYIEIDSTLIPTGEIAKVEGTVFDFRNPKIIGKDLSKQSEIKQLRYGLGYDHNWIINKKEGEMSFAGSIFDPSSGRKLEVFTEEPVLLFYGGNFMNGKDTGKYGRPLKYRESFCLETQHYPNSPNHKNFPSIILNPEKVYQTKSIYKFSIE
jgi:aldose 1-epimerase